MPAKHVVQWTVSLRMLHLTEQEKLERMMISIARLPAIRPIRTGNAHRHIKGVRWNMRRINILIASSIRSRDAPRGFRRQWPVRVVSSSRHSGWICGLGDISRRVRLLYITK